MCCMHQSANINYAYTYYAKQLPLKVQNCLKLCYSFYQLFGWLNKYTSIKPKINCVFNDKASKANPKSLYLESKLIISSYPRMPPDDPVCWPTSQDYHRTKHSLPCFLWSEMLKAKKSKVRRKKHFTSELHFPNNSISFWITSYNHE